MIDAHSHRLGARIGKLKGAAKPWQVTARDAASSYAMAKVDIVQKGPLVSEGQGTVDPSAAERGLPQRKAEGVVRSPRGESDTPRPSRTLLQRKPLMQQLPLRVRLAVVAGTPDETWQSTCIRGLACLRAAAEFGHGPTASRCHRAERNPTQSSGQGSDAPMANPLVSICIPTYNAERTVAETLRSILGQTYWHIEVLVVDNASQDGTLRVVEQFDDQRIQIYRNDENIGWLGNYRRCVELATGEYIAVFHADDVYLPDMVSRQLQTFHERPSVAAVFTLNKTINEDGKILTTSAFPSELREKALLGFDEVLIATLRHGNFLTCPSAMVRADVYRKAIPFDSERFGSAADLAIWLSILERHPISVIEEPLMHYRISQFQSSWQDVYLRTESATYFRVMDYYLFRAPGAVRIPRDALAKHEFARVLDAIRCGENYLIKGEIDNARRNLKRAFSIAALRGVARNSTSPLLLRNWALGIILYCAIGARWGKRLGKVVWWLLYGRKKWLLRDLKSEIQTIGGKQE